MPEEQRAGEAAAHDRRGEGQPDQHGGDRHVDRDVDERRGQPGHHVPAEQEHAGHERRGEQDHAEVDRQRAGLGDGGDPVGDGVEAAQRGEVAAGGRRQALAGGQHGADAAGGRGTATMPPARATADSSELDVEPVPQREVDGADGAVERVGGGADEAVDQARAGRRARR